MTGLKGTSEKDCQILNHIVRHALLVAEKPKRVPTDKCYQPMFDIIDWWVKDVIGYPKFGGAEFKRFDDELRVRQLQNWDHYINL